MRSPGGLRNCDKGEIRMASEPRLRRLAVIGGLAIVVAAGLFVTVTNAEAATVFSADFESGSTSGWSKSGGTWAIVSDGSQVFQQSDSSSERAREFAWRHQLDQLLGAGAGEGHLVRVHGRRRRAHRACLRLDQDVPAVTDRQ